MSQTPTKIPASTSKAPSMRPVGPMRPSNLRQVAMANQASKVQSAMPYPDQGNESVMPTQSKFRDQSNVPSIMPTQSKFRDLSKVPGSIMPDSSKFRDSTQVPASVVPGGSILEGAYDEMMAERQTRIPTLAPAERAEQEDWAQQKLALGGSCYDGAEWERVDAVGGYKCSAGRHWVSDDLLSEGKGGWFLMLNKHDMSSIKGHYYGNPVQEPWAITRRGEKFKIENGAIVMLKDD